MMSIGEDGFSMTRGLASDLQILVFRSKMPGRVDYGGSEIDGTKHWSDPRPRPIYRINVCWHHNKGTEHDWRFYRESNRR